ncbi:hypothetical protein ACFC39_28990, partial [Streptomyces sp. NPDC056049]
TMDLDRATALVAAAGIGCGMLAYTAVTVVSLRVLAGRELLRRRPGPQPPAAAPPAPQSAVVAPAGEEVR